MLEKLRLEDRHVESMSVGRHLAEWVILWTEKTKSQAELFDRGTP